MKINKEMLKKIIKEVMELEEGISNIVYHITTLERAASIIEEDRFMTTPVLGSDFEQHVNKNKLYFFSTARSRLSSYTRDPSFLSVLFTLDGRKMQNRYKGAAVDYWGPKWRKSDSQCSEMEDRIITDKPEIENAKNYIIEISVYADLNRIVSNLNDIYEKNIDNLQKLFDSNKPVFIYTDRKDYLTNNKKNAITSGSDFMELLKKYSKEIKKTEFGDYDPNTPERIGRRVEHLKQFTDILDLIDQREFNKIVEMAKDKSYKDMFNYLLFYPNDAFEHFKNEIHNLKSEKYAREYIVKIGKYLRKHKYENLNHLIQEVQKTIKFIFQQAREQGTW